ECSLLSDRPFAEGMKTRFNLKLRTLVCERFDALPEVEVDPISNVLFDEIANIGTIVDNTAIHSNRILSNRSLIGDLACFPLIVAFIDINRYHVRLQSLIIRRRTL
ncbi:hypothetical protein PENTCL1PPCAC_26108, partial [Pristionchus entomophagus]